MTEKGKSSEKQISPPQKQTHSPPKKEQQTNKPISRKTFPQQRQKDNNKGMPSNSPQQQPQAEQPSQSSIFARMFYFLCCCCSPKKQDGQPRPIVEEQQMPGLSGLSKKLNYRIQDFQRQNYQKTKLFYEIIKLRQEIDSTDLSQQEQKLATIFRYEAVKYFYKVSNYKEAEIYLKKLLQKQKLLQQCDFSTLNLEIFRFLASCLTQPSLAKLKSLLEKYKKLTKKIEASQHKDSDQMQLLINTLLYHFARLCKNTEPFIDQGKEDKELQQQLREQFNQLLSNSLKSIITNLQIISLAHCQFSLKIEQIHLNPFDAEEQNKRTKTTRKRQSVNHNLQSVPYNRKQSNIQQPFNKFSTFYIEAAKKQKWMSLYGHKIAFQKQKMNQQESLENQDELRSTQCLIPPKEKSITVYTAYIREKPHSQQIPNEQMKFYKDKADNRQRETDSEKLKKQSQKLIQSQKSNKQQKKNKKIIHRRPQDIVNFQQLKTEEQASKNHHPIRQADYYKQSPPNRQPITKTSKTTNPSRTFNRGLKNLGNTCYMNSALQCLHKSKAFNTKFKSTVKALIRQNSRIPQLTKYTQVLFDQLQRQNQRYPYSPKQIKSIVSENNILFQGHQQNDAVQFLSTFLETMSNELNNPSQKNNISKINQDFNDQDMLMLQKLKNQSKTRSIVSQIFSGYYKTVYKCQQCLKIYKLFQKFNVHYVPIPQPKIHSSRNNNSQQQQVYSLNQCLQDFQISDQLKDNNAFPCDQCEIDTRTTKTMKIYEANQILIISLKRFHNDNKNNRQIYIPMELQPQQFIENGCNERYKGKIYKLYAALIHSGSIHGGHYTAACLDFSCNRWKLYNDSFVEEISLKDLSSELRSAYTVFYELSDKQKSKKMNKRDQF